MTATPVLLDPEPAPPMPASFTPQLFNVACAAQLLGISVKTVRRETTIGRLPCARVGSRTIRYNQAHIDEYIRRCTDDGRADS